MLAMAATMSLQQIGRVEGLSRERVRQVLAQAGFSRRQVVRHCAGCGVPLTGFPTAKYCGEAACQAGRARAKLEAKRLARCGPPKRCANCQGVLRGHTRTDGPSFCSKNQACRAARQKWLYHNSPTYRAYCERYRQSERGRELIRAATARSHAKRWAANEAKREERRQQRLAERAAARGLRAARDAERAAERAAAQERRAAADADAAARAREAIRLYRTLQLSERAVAAQLGVSRTIVHYWVAGKRRPTALAAEMGGAG